MGEIKPKWKTFAVEHMLSNWNKNISAEWVFDLIAYCPELHIRETLDENGILIWAPFESLSLEDFAYKLVQLATTAQLTEELK